VAGNVIDVSYFAPPGNSVQDWIALYVEGASDQAYLAWKYIEGFGSRQTTFQAPVTSGFYELRYLLNNGYTVAARSAVIAVVAAANRAPVWNMAPIYFVQGTRRTVRLTDYASDPDGDPLQFAEVAGLDPQYVGAFQWNRDTFELSYDGRDLGAVEGTPVEINSGIQLRADDGRAPATFQ
jgi:hypothetical protein